MSSRMAARLGAAFLLTLTPVIGLVGSAQAKIPPTGNCTTAFQDEIHPGVDVASYNYIVCTGSNGSWTRSNFAAYIVHNGVLVSGSTTGGAPYLGNSGPGYAVYVCNGSSSGTFYLYGPGQTVSVACG